MFRYYPLCFNFIAKRSIAFPHDCAANLFRGALGMLLRNSGRYEIFAPREESGPSGLRDRPRPFVFRTVELDGRTVAPGDAFSIRMNVFDSSVVEAIRDAWNAYDQAALHAVTGMEPIYASVLPGAPAQSAHVRFITPLELKSEGRIATAPDFDVLLRRIRDRVSTLSELYGAGPLDLDFREFGERTSQVRMTHCDVRRVTAERTSRSTGQTHSLGGLVGEATYEGSLGEFSPWLELARHTGVGRQTVWGKGELHTTFHASGA